MASRKLCSDASIILNELKSKSKNVMKWNVQDFRKGFNILCTDLMSFLILNLENRLCLVDIV